MNQSLLKARPEWGWNPVEDLRTLRSGLNRVLATLTGGRVGRSDAEVTPTDGGYTVVVRLPGVAPEEVAVELDDRALCVRARTPEEVDADNGIPDGAGSTRAFEHRIDLPADVDLSRVDAVMDHGLLTVTLPRGTRVLRRTIVVGRRQYDPERPAGARPEPAARTPPPEPKSRPGPVTIPDPVADREMHRPDVSFPTAGGQIGW
ncbi:Hsp20/alpha crystallin family protein [Polymorphospora sp. NPDC050346]|uniref:Hsp20/alpha crystallin family protein n=1 Tax=Polymorphospora sp. NPDC050346 TaxID=3155780 RepID=UPI00340283EC